MTSPAPSSRRTVLQLLVVCLCVVGGVSVVALGTVDRWVEPGPTTAAVAPLAEGEDAEELGAVLLPPDTPLEQAQTYDWTTESLRPPRHRVTYGLGTTLDAWLEDQHRAFARRLRYRSLGDERFTYQAPRGCSADMRCIYEELIRSNAGPVKALGERFEASIRERDLDAAQAAQLILGFVQRIHYELPRDEPFGIVPPALVPARNRGDCDSKAVLAVMLLQQVGIDAVVLYSDPLAHAAVGVDLPGGRTRLRYGGRSYQYAEVTTDGWPLGMIPPRYDKPHLWVVLPVGPGVNG
ncbi:hypothetical protein LZ198_34785 [Myxococcus sp. K15C18031901]|uniref:hypothetical protein n=1 Tax=Myxococcus dinghuensis TaxID=2906761 RepID=UPI0020A788BA|nr:hypothetical protein [Myxococcus dinghuensis]MCP3104053.1 hypothetical protein [Myxococcus dinghuensis]